MLVFDTTVVVNLILSTTKTRYWKRLLLFGWRWLVKSWRRKKGAAFLLVAVTHYFACRRSSKQEQGFFAARYLEVRRIVWNSTQLYGSLQQIFPVQVRRPPYKVKRRVRVRACSEEQRAHNLIFNAIFQILRELSIYTHQNSNISKVPPLNKVLYIVRQSPNVIV